MYVVYWWEVAENDPHFCGVQEFPTGLVGILQRILEHFQDCPEDVHVVRLSLDQLVEDVLPEKGSTYAHIQTRNEANDKVWKICFLNLQY